MLIKMKQARKYLQSAAEEGVNIEANALLNVNESDNNAQVSNENKHGWSFGQLNVLLASGMAGGGILILPSALAGTGWLGVPIMIVISIMASFSCQRLGDCWTIIEERTPEIRNHQRSMYSIIVKEALGITLSVIVSAASILSTLCAGAIYLLMAAQIIETELVTLLPDTAYCTWYLILVACNIPFLYFKRLRDYPLIGRIACVATIFATILYFIQMMIDAQPFTVFRLGLHGFKDFFLAFGTIMFAFGGAPTFPTVQNNTDRPTSNKNLKFYFIGTLFIYILIAITGYAVYGEFVAPNVSMSIKPTPLTSIANVSMIVHLLSAFGFLLNSTLKEFEELCNIPQDSVISRLLSRASVMVAILFVGESIPKFDTVIALIGGTTVAILTFVLPSYCYIELINQNRTQRRDNFERPGWIRFACWQVIIIGLLGGLATTFSSISAMSSTTSSLVRPCYIY